MISTEAAGGDREVIAGTAWCFGDDVSTDVIHPPDFYSLNKDKVKSGLFQRYDPTLQDRIRPGDVLIGGRNFGCGSSRETTVLSLLHNGIGAIVARSFGRIFFRNATNKGLRCLVMREAPATAIATGARVTISLAKWSLSTDVGIHVALAPASPFVRRIWQAGGLLAMLDEERRAGRRPVARVASGELDR